MSAVIDSIIVLLTPFLVLAYLAGSALIYHRKVGRGENGIYTAMVWSLLILAGSWVLVEISYLRNLLDLLDSPSDVFVVRFFRLTLLLAAFWNLNQYYRGMR